MIKKDNLDSLRNELSVNSKNGMDFTLAASVVWLIITYVWTLENSSYNKSVITFIVGGAMMPLAMLLFEITKDNLDR